MNLTNEYPVFVRARFLKRSEGAEGLVHAAIGMMGELLELGSSPDRANVVEELGDIEFYRCAGLGVLGLPWGRLDSEVGIPGGWVYVYPSFLHGCEVFQDQAKKCWVYDKPVAVDSFTSALWTIEGCLKKTYTIFGLNREEVIRENMKKLTKRYPTGYTDALAAARKDKVA